MIEDGSVDLEAGTEMVKEHLLQTAGIVTVDPEERQFSAGDHCAVRQPPLVADRRALPLASDEGKMHNPVDELAKALTDRSDGVC